MRGPETFKQARPKIEKGIARRAKEDPTVTRTAINVYRDAWSKAGLKPHEVQEKIREYTEWLANTDKEPQGLSFTMASRVQKVPIHDSSFTNSPQNGQVSHKPSSGTFQTAISNTKSP